MQNIEVSVVIPCLDEADTLAICIDKAKNALEQMNCSHEIIIADNGSTDGSPDIAIKHGARVVNVPVKGYGSALMAGIADAKGTYVLMGDADDSYDFTEIPKFIEKIREGYDIVQGCRLSSGGGTVMPGAMPWSHRWIGNPMFSFLARWWFNAPINDIYCGMRAFTKELQIKLNQKCTGMEFATEMIIKASLMEARFAQVPITLHPDGRVSHPPHLNTINDGWRTLRFFLLCSPYSLFLLPGILMIMIGMAGFSAALYGFQWKGVTFDAHTLLFASAAIYCGYQSVLFSIIAKTHAINIGMLPEDKWYKGFYSFFTLEKALLTGSIAFIIGLFTLLGVFFYWRSLNYGALEYSRTMRWVIPAMILTTIGFQTITTAFIVSMIGLRKE